MLNGRRNNAPMTYILTAGGWRDGIFIPAHQSLTRQTRLCGMFALFSSSPFAFVARIGVAISWCMAFEDYIYKRALARALYHGALFGGGSALAAAAFHLFIIRAGVRFRTSL